MPVPESMQERSTALFLYARMTVPLCKDDRREEAPRGRARVSGSVRASAVTGLHPVCAGGQLLRSYCAWVSGYCFHCNRHSARVTEKRKRGRRRSAAREMASEGEGGGERGRGRPDGPARPVDQGPVESDRQTRAGVACHIRVIQMRSPSSPAASPPRAAPAARRARRARRAHRRRQGS